MTNLLPLFLLLVGAPPAHLSETFLRNDRQQVLQYTPVITPETAFTFSIVKMNGTLYFPLQLSSEINNTYYNIVNGTLESIYPSLLASNVTNYQVVQSNIETGLNDYIKYYYSKGINIEGLNVKMVNLYNGLQLLLNGLLGQNGSSSDIFDAISSKYGCGSQLTYNLTAKIVTIVNIGGAILGFYTFIRGVVPVTSYDFNNPQPWATTLDIQKQLILTKLTPLAQTNCSDLSWTSMNSKIRQIVLSAPAGATTGYINNALYTNITNTFGSRGTWFLYNTQPSYSVNAAFKLSGNYTTGGASNSVSSTIAYLLFRNYLGYNSSVVVNWSNMQQGLQSNIQNFANATAQTILNWLLNGNFIDSSTGPVSWFIFKNPFIWAASTSSPSMPCYMNTFTFAGWSIAIYIM